MAKSWKKTCEADDNRILEPAIGHRRSLVAAVVLSERKRQQATSNLTLSMIAVVQGLRPRSIEIWSISDYRQSLQEACLNLKCKSRKVSPIQVWMMSIASWTCIPKPLNTIIQINRRTASDTTKNNYRSCSRSRLCCESSNCILRRKRRNLNLRGSLLDL